MNFPTAIKACLRKYANAGGRASRAEFWYFVLFTFLIGTVADIIDGRLFGTASAVVGFAFMLPSVAVLIRRLHDLGRSGRWALLVAAPIIGELALSYLCAQPGTAGDNRFGPPPADARPEAPDTAAVTA